MHNPIAPPITSTRSIEFNVIFSAHEKLILPNCVPFLLILTSIHVIEKTDTRTTTVAATTTMTLKDVVPAEKTLMIQPTQWIVDLRVSGVLFEFLSSIMKISSPFSFRLWIGNSASIS